MNKPYNETQINTIVRYCKEQDITRLKLNAYIAITGTKDEHGYTKAHNADVGNTLTTPDTLGADIEDLIKKHPNADVTLSSQVEVKGSAKYRHIQMLDFITPYVPHLSGASLADLFSDVEVFLNNKIGWGVVGPGRFYVSGNSYHAYGFCRPPFEEIYFNDVVGAFLICDHDRIVDHQWLGYSLSRKEFRLRLTSVQAKYTMVPTPTNHLLGKVAIQDTDSTVF